MFFYNPKGKKNCQIIVAADGHCLTKTNYGVKPSIITGAKVYPKAKKWIVEVKIPLKYLPCHFPQGGSQLRANFCRNRPRRYNEAKNHWTYSSWARILNGTYFTPSKFGKIIFQK
jgi:hypothetical protein